MRHHDPGQQGPGALPNQSPLAWDGHSGSAVVDLPAPADPPTSASMPAPADVPSSVSPPTEEQTPAATAPAPQANEQQEVPRRRASTATLGGTFASILFHLWLLS